MKSAKKLGIKTVAVYSEVDARSLHVSMADEAYYIGGATSAESYLIGQRIIDTALKSGSKAIHPGYGFLSESADFADLVERSGLIFIGPTSGAMRGMGDKINSKKKASSAGCFTIPGFQGEIADVTEARKHADEIGYPVMLKASAGGGGKGMRIVWSAEELSEAFLLCQSEATSSFGDKRLLIERFVTDPHHIEIQVMVDNFGNVVAFPERECSVQRRNQKVVEETPSPHLTLRPDVRKAMQLQAIALCKATAYRSAGTVEMLCDGDHNFYFLEMNTRLQVEHPVTELVSGQDLVELMIKVAAGHRLPAHLLAHPDGCLPADGWAVECRVYAEDPLRGFTPSPGPLLTYLEPDLQTVPGVTVRLDSGVFEGDTITPFYDPLISKISTHAPQRNLAISAMNEALQRFVVRGLGNNLSFLTAVMTNERFKKGEYGTGFIAQEFPGGFKGVQLDCEGDKQLVAVASAVHYLRTEQYSGETVDELVVVLGTRQGPGSESRAYSVSLALDDTPTSSGSHDESDGGSLSVTLSNADSVGDVDDAQEQSIVDRLLVTSLDWRTESVLGEVTIRDRAGKESSFAMQYGGPVRSGLGYRLGFRGTDSEVLVLSPLQYRLHKYALPLPDKKLSPLVRSPMAGTIQSCEVQVGAVVEVGAPLVTIEAMKMQNVLRAERAGTVGKLLCKVGDRVQSEQAILEYQEL